MHRGRQESHPSGVSPILITHIWCSGSAKTRRVNHRRQSILYGVGRVVLTPFGPYPYSQAALDTPEKPLLAVGVAGAYMPGLDPGERKTLAGRLGNTQVVPVKSDVYQLTGDVAFKYRNFSFEGAYHFRIIEPSAAYAPTRFGRESASGYYVQAGYFLIPKHLEIAGRYSYVDRDNPTQKGQNKQHEVTGGVSYYFVGHSLKIQGNYSYFHNQTALEGLDNHVWQTQVTLMF